MGSEHLGLYKKFHVKRTDGESEHGGRHENCKYFVIDMDHDEFAADTLEKYAELCQGKYPILAADLREEIAKMRETNDNGE